MRSKFAFPGNPGNTFYAYIRDHNCSAVSNAYTITGVSGSGGNYDVGTLSLYVPARGTLAMLIDSPKSMLLGTLALFVTQCNTVENVEPVVNLPFPL
jgi:hypothetical protein